MKEPRDLEVMVKAILDRKPRVLEMLPRDDKLIERMTEIRRKAKAKLA